MRKKEKNFGLIDPLDPKWKSMFEPVELSRKPVWTATCVSSVLHRSLFSSL
jgi:hypothetical protein